MIRSLCVYCASNSDTPESLRLLARELGRRMGEGGIRLIYGGASVGLMGEVADAVLAAGGEAIGVIPEHLKAAEVAHVGLTELIVTPDMHTRKRAMFDRADAFVALPGSVGTLEELLEIIGWKYLGLHIRPVYIVNHDGFFDGLLVQFARCRAEGVMRPGTEGAWRVVADIDELFRMIEQS